jgi:hypothetical protein
MTLGPTQRPTTALLASHQIHLAQTGWITTAFLRSLALSWCFANGVDKDAIEASLAANIDGQINPTQASGVPW